MSLKRASWTDPEGRKRIVLVPEGREEDAEIGIPLGPPSFTDLNLPSEIEVRLNNELVNRGIVTATDALRGRQEIMLAIQSVLKIDVDKVLLMYVGSDYKNARPAKEPIVSVNGSKPQPQRRRR